MPVDLNHDRIFLRQRREIAELFGVETRNKYEILTMEGTPLGFVAEEGKGIGAFFGRAFLGHWRTFTINIFDTNRSLAYKALHPFRFLFQRLEISKATGQRIGALEQRFGVITKRFDLEDAHGNVIMKMAASFWKPWTFPIYKNGEEVALILKKWSGTFSEIFTDRDNFTIEFKDKRLTATERELILASAMFVDLNYFERKAGTNS
nr:phospholipid scramblase-related protein [Bacteriovorax sp. HI3]